jgi:hypothetical protein
MRALLAGTERHDRRGLRVRVTLGASFKDNPAADHRHLDSRVAECGWF